MLHVGLPHRAGARQGIDPRLAGDAQARLEDATAAGGSTVYGSGMNPGFADLLAIVASHGVREVEQVRVLESVNTAAYESAEGQWLSGNGSLARRARPGRVGREPGRRCSRTPSR